MMKFKCRGCCSQGRNCTCSSDMVDEIESVEASHPWLLLLYAVAIVGSIALSSLFPWGVQP